MKKLLPGIFAVMAIVSCQNAGKQTQTEMAMLKTDTVKMDTSIVQKSLNGIPESTAKSMIDYFNTTADNSPKSTQLWFDKKVIDSIVTLFHTDSTYGAVKPDGIRLYFSRTPPTASLPDHLNTNLVIVSTYYAGTVTEGSESVKVHADYYAHPATAGLFSLSAALLGGELTHYTDNSNGTLLYGTCNCDAPFTMENPHDILPSVAEKMAKDFPGVAFNSKSEWFDLDIFKHFKKRLDKDGGDGVRIYFGRGLDKADNKVKAKLLFVETMAVIPATSPATHQDYFGNKTKPGVNTNPPPPPPPNVGETGESCPPHCD